MPLRRSPSSSAPLHCSGTPSLGLRSPAAVPAATFRDPANDVKAGDVDLRSISVGKQNGALVDRFTVRKPITEKR